jgi:hypothetical protein
MEVDSGAGRSEHDEGEGGTPGPDHALPGISLGGDRPQSVGELRASVAICHLLLSSLVRQEELSPTVATVLRDVAAELEGDVLFLATLDD